MSTKNDEMLGWTSAPPTEQGTYWHWNGDVDCIPVPTFVFWSGTSGKCFVPMGQLSLSRPIDCDQYGGFWQPLPEPRVPDRYTMDRAIAAAPEASVADVLLRELKAVEWSHRTRRDDKPACVRCGWIAEGGHSPDCSLAAAIALAERKAK